jgi:quinol monooxygenase YgiN
VNETLSHRGPGLLASGTNRAGERSVIIGTIRLLPPSNRRAEVLELLRSVRGPLRVQPGCVACDIYEEDESRPAVVFVERWASKGALEAHLRSDMCRRILAAVELSGGPPDIRFEHVSAIEGVEIIEQARTRSWKETHS